MQVGELGQDSGALGELCGGNGLAVAHDLVLQIEEKQRGIIIGGRHGSSPCKRAAGHAGIRASTWAAAARRQGRIGTPGRIAGRAAPAPWPPPPWPPR